MYRINKNIISFKIKVSVPFVVLASVMSVQLQIFKIGIKNIRSNLYNCGLYTQLYTGSIQYQILY